MHLNSSVNYVASRMSPLDERQIEVFGQVSNQTWGVATLPGSLPSFTSEDIETMIGIGIEPGRQNGTVLVRAWLGASQNDSISGTKNWAGASS